MTNTLCFDSGPDHLSSDDVTRHEELVDVFGKFLIWQRNRTLDVVRRLVESSEARDQLGSLRRAPYDAVAQLESTERSAVSDIAEETLNCFLERLLWALGDEGVDARFGSRHAYRFRLQLEIVDSQSGEIIEDRAINRGGKRFFGSNWGRWWNKFKKL